MTPAADRADAEKREILTPEGVRLSVRLASLSARASAVMIDILVILLVLIAAVLLLVLVLGGVGGGREVTIALFAMAAFFGRVLYFPIFETRWGGRTPGKKALRLRVIGRQGAPLDAGAILSRNLVREVELWLPLTLLFMESGGNPWSWLAMAGWVGCVAAIPLLNRDRMRGGDLLAGTWVIEEPRAELQRDLMQTAAAGDAPAAPAAAADFTPAQLEVYGAKELKVLADVLANERAFDADRKVRTVAELVRAKIGYDGPLSDDRAFLNAYYRAARAKMETDAQWGRLKSDKHDSRRPARRLRG